VAGVFSGEFAMTAVAVGIVWAAIIVVSYVYAGYPILLWILTRRTRRTVLQEDIAPAVTLVISAFNEAPVIGAKLENALSLDYPRERLEILVMSDASTDATDSIVDSFAERGVKLLRMRERQGKTVGLNAALPNAGGEIIVFSDANILYRKDVIRRLVRNFADPSVGCVTGNSCYAANSNSAAYVQENTYWRYEQTIRELESRLGSTVGGDGAIFAIRKELYTPLSADAINDLVIPLQIVARGYRAIFEPSAVGFEPSTADFAGEFRRKRRIVNRSWRGVRTVHQVLNPRAVGIFAWQVWSHKVLRWLMLPIVLTGAAGCFIAFPAGLIYRVGALGFVASVAIAGIGALVKHRLGRSARLAQGLFYFYMVNLAAFLGIATAIFGRVEVVWTPER
jgi:cellulose synthase/poly-beta-1,6-N-acetylglucosamine synthase-like glycosyltransferase